MEIKRPRPNSFVVGFLTAMVLVGLVYAWSFARYIGGVVAESPNGRYRLNVNAPLSPTSGGSYDIELTGQESGEVVRRVVVTLPSREKTVSLREGGGTIDWDPSSSYADVKIDGEDAIRV